MKLNSVLLNIVYYTLKTDPSRWRRVVKCRTAHRDDSQKSFKGVISCNERDDEKEKFEYKIKQYLVVFMQLTPYHSCQSL